ncbi:hypothetical protein DFH08DRAFT_970463 [Mycena albidolilacea]|uniref:DUF6534 domain-containing protein n=1 Tax=Mycena albidolilacea TaxID=1033008 RepID=A0AAD6ZFF6_9AGAR|nr:hypothetical protein DFH08DRAFT_970463 [Mycena albidolilacea]
MVQTLVPTLGVTLIGIFISCTLYGVTTLQTFIYIKRFWNTDLTILRLFVILIWILETAHEAFVCSYIFRATIIDIIKDPGALLRTRVSDDITTAITGLIIFFVQGFYIWRLWILSNKKLILVVPLAILVVAHLGLEMAVMALTFKWPEFVEFHRITGYFTGAVGVAAATDITIAAAMFVLLKRRKTGVKSTEQLLNRIVTYTISTGLLTSVVDIVILFVALPNDLVYLCFFDFVPNLYSNSLLAMLNSRSSSVPGDLHLEVDIEGSSETVQFANFRSRNATRNTGNTSSTELDQRKPGPWIISKSSNGEISTSAS